MRLENVKVVAKREYLQRVKSKGFWIGTVVLPLFILAVTVLPSYFLSKSRTSQKIVVVDVTGRVGAALLEGSRRGDAERKGVPQDRIASFDIALEPPAGDREAQRESLNRRVLDEEIDAWVWVGEGALTGEPVRYHARSVSNIITQELLEDDLSAVVRQARFADAGLDPARVDELARPVRLETVRVSEGGSRAEAGIGGAAFAYVLFFILYMILMIWGQQVMNGVLEEKGSRVVEIVVSSVKPFELMMGKLTGICLVGLTQFAIWLGTAGVITAPGVMASLAVLPEEVSLPQLTVAMVVNYVLFFILGFFVYASLYAAIGAAFNNLQEAQQVAGVAGFFFVVPFFFMFPIINDPNSTMAVVTSLIPPLTPLLMALRVSLQMPPLWQLLLGYALTLAFIFGMIWVCARIYRIGILMYGKKPTFKELWRWVRYA
jgi:ABC-2 type transport system permease protein